MANIADGVSGDFKPHHFWIAQLLPPPNPNYTVVWKTRHALPPDVSAGSYCCKVQWFQRTVQGGRVLRLTTAQYISLSCIIPVNFDIIVRQGNMNDLDTLFELDQEVEEKILVTLNGLVIDD